MKVKKNIVSSCWPFKIDSLESYVYWNFAFSLEECEEIIKIGHKNGFIKGKTKGGDEKKIRKSNISWIYPSKESDFIFRRITDIVMNLNNQFFKFDIYGMIEGLQLTHYKEPDGKYQKHIDRFINGQIRKLSVSIQLSNPNSYEGGELIIHNGQETILPKEQGNLVMFPSFSLHEVKPVTKGERYSLVAWITGPEFK